MGSRAVRRTLAMSSALSLGLGVFGSPAVAQITPGDRSGTPAEAGPGQSAATVTQAPAASAPASASAAPATPNGSGDIIVTARRVEERLQDVPISITVFNQQQLENRNVTTATDLATYTPSLSADTRFGSQNSSFAIRGFVQDVGTPPSVGVYFADVVAPRASFHNLPGGNGAGPGSFFDLQNVQVLKGPQGTLFGRNTTGGAVLLVPQKPTSRLEGYVEGSYGNYDLKRIQAVLNAPLGDIARFRIGVDHETRDGYLHNRSGVGPSRYDDLEYTAVRASLVVDLTPDLENYIIASYTHSSPTGYDTKVIDAGGARPPTPSPAGAALLQPLAQAQLAREQAAGFGFYDFESDFVNPQAEQTQWQVINTTTWRTSDNLTIKNIVSYAQVTADLSSPFFGTAFDVHDLFFGFLAPPGTRLTFASAVPIPGEHSAAQSTVTEELQIQGNAADNRLTYQVGGYYESSDPLAESGSLSPLLVYCRNAAAFDCTAPLSFLGVGAATYDASQTTFHNKGVYAQASYALTDTLKFTGGIRYTWDSTKSVARTIDYAYVTTDSTVAACAPASGTLPRCEFKVQQKSHAPTWLIDADYKPTSDLLLYAKWSRGYRAGGVTPQGPETLRTFAPEKVDAYEGGAKFSLSGPLHGFLNIAGFYNDFSNQQAQLNVIRFPASLYTVVKNIGKSRIFGAEIEASVSPFAGATLDASYAYLNTKVQRVTAPVIPAGYTSAATLTVGDPLSLSPPHKVSATASYLLPLDSLLGKITVAATFTYTSRQVATGASPTSDPNNPYTEIPSTQLLNLNLNWACIAGSRLDLSLFATNVTNEKYYTAFSNLLNTVGFEVGAVGEPRTYGARLRYRF